MKDLKMKIVNKGKGGETEEIQPNESRLGEKKEHAQRSQRVRINQKMIAYSSAKLGYLKSDRREKYLFSATSRTEEN